MTWTEIYNKYKDTELMKEFLGYIYDESGPELGIVESLMGIKDIFGYLICFAETKGSTIDWIKNKFCLSKKCKNPEQAMNWCAEKFFEET